MKILITTPIFYPHNGGIENHVKNLIQNLNIQNVETSLLIFNKLNLNFDTSLTKNTYFFKTFGLKPFEITLQFFRLYNLIKQFDLIHIHDPHVTIFSLLILFFSRIQGKKVLISSHGYIFHNQQFILLKKLYFFLIQKNLYKLFTKVIAVSRTDYHYVENIKNSILIENGINADKFHPLNNDVADENSFIFFGRNSPNKDIPSIVKLLNMYILQSYNRKISLYLLIDKMSTELEKEIKVTNVNLKIHVLYNVSDDELVNTLLKVKYFISASKYEGFGISVLEAMIAKKIVIVNNIEPVNNFVKNGRGFLLDFSDLVNSRKELEYLLKQDTSYVINNNIDFVQQFFWTKKIIDFIRVYEESY